MRPRRKTPSRHSNNRRNAPARPYHARSSKGVITTNEELKAFCELLATGPYIALDTEFMREKTYYPTLCLIQAGNDEYIGAIDPLAEGLDLQPLFDLILNDELVKIFHACKQDMEIFYNIMGGKVPQNMFDTQVAAMVCGFGENASYARLVKDVLGVNLEKAQQFTDWAQRPLRPEQVEYALGDVTYLPELYHHLSDILTQVERQSWIEEEMKTLIDPETYNPSPEKAWEKMRLRSRNPLFVAMVQGLAAWREREAQRRNHPRQWVVKDDGLMEIAATTPQSVEALRRLRGVRGHMSDSTAEAIVGVVLEVLAKPSEDLPKLPRPAIRPAIPDSTVELLRVLLWHCAEVARVAPRMLANTWELEEIALYAEKAEVDAMHGWRREVFGQYALELCQGKVSLTIHDGGKLRLLRHTGK